MFNSKKKESNRPEGFDTLVGINSVFEGNITSDGTVRIDGRVKGDIRATGNVFIGNNGGVTGNISAQNVHLSGFVEGNILAKELLRILSTAKLHGDIQMHSFVADEGAIFQGKCSMLEEVSDIPSDVAPEKSTLKKGHAGRDYKKSSALSQIDDDKEKNTTITE